MTRLNFRFLPRDPGDFDVCCGPTRPVRVPPPEPPETRETAPAATPPAAPGIEPPAKG